MTGFDLIDLPWLPGTSADFRERLKAIEASGVDDWAAAVRGLANQAMNLNQATMLARVVQKLQRSRPTRALVPFKLGIVSNATTDLLTPLLQATAVRYGLLLDLCVADFDQAMQAALDPSSAINRFGADAVLVALDYRGLPFRQGKEGTWPPFEASRALDELATIREGFRRNGNAVSLVQTIPPPASLLFGSLDLSQAGSLRAAVAQFNSALAADATRNGDYLLDVEWLASCVGLDRWYDDRNWYIARLPFAQRALPLYADFVVRVPAAIRGKTRKCLVMDLDNTLWGGVIGDDGLEGISLGEGDARGEAFRSVQAMAADLRRKGIVLAVCSKNDDATARLPFREHRGMILREDDIAVFIANWTDKASNLERIAQQLELGLDAMVLLDDNPIEREQVRQALPQVAVPELGDDPSTFARAVLAGGYFESIALTRDDLARAEQYRSNAVRNQLQQSSRDLGEFLRSLDTQIRFASFDATGRKRITQLINKTNQFNVTTRRYTETQVTQFESSPSHYTLQVHVTDRFGDNGMVGVVICERNAEEWHIDTWLMSCRVLNRRVEEAVCNKVAHDAVAAGARRLVGHYEPTERNGIVADLFRRLGFQQTDGSAVNSWILDLERFRPFDVPVRIVT